MAKPKAETNAASAPADEAFDYSQFLPKGMSIADFAETGGLTPIYSTEEAFTNGWAPVVGEIDRIEFLPPQNVGTKNEWIPAMLRVVSLVHTKAMTSGDDAKEVDIKPGDDVLVPVTGALKVNRQILAAAMDPQQVFTAIFRVTGQQQVNNMPSAMWKWDAKLFKNTKPRVGRFALKVTNSPAAPAEVLDRNNKPVASLVGGDKSTATAAS